ncbi:polysaccharide export protein [Halieaceae bacterium IMCC14734]|uniref:Polysaccharide export protein n=2 Tax=Candidatus Litorirhabdus singularis TaxID=2518993 RepID=A0ABT3TIJ9_9GAMM|nr:polysaccharide export protein [Candidatus Litorirhabdus singularis]
MAVTLLITLGSVATAQESGSYVLGPGDRIAITVFGQTDLSMEFTLSDAGTRNYPFLGEIVIAGMTLPRLEQRIADGLRGDYLINPDVSVSITQYRLFFINGEVNRPGGYPYQPGLTLEKALALAGGLGPRAATDEIVVKRASKALSAAVAIEMSEAVHAGDVIDVPQSFF